MDTLRAELLEDSEGVGYAPLIASGSDNQIANLLNAPRYAGPGPVDIATVLIWIAKHSLMARLRTAVAGDNAQAAGIAEVALLLVGNPNIPAIDLALPDVQQMFGVLVAAGVLDAEEHDELFALSTVMRSRAETLFGPSTHVSTDDISRALAGVGDD